MKRARLHSNDLVVTLGWSEDSRAKKNSPLIKLSHVHLLHPSMHPILMQACTRTYLYVGPASVLEKEGKKRKAKIRKKVHMDIVRTPTIRQARVIPCASRGRHQDYWPAPKSLRPSCPSEEGKLLSLELGMSVCASIRAKKLANMATET